MKNIYIKIFSVLLIVIGVAACSEDDRLMFGDIASIRFRLPEKEDLIDIKGDTVILSFINGSRELTEYTVNIPVEIVSHRINRDRYFRVALDSESSKAVEGVDFKKLEDRYLLPAGEGEGILPLVVNRTLEMQNETKYIQLKLVESDDFGVELEEGIRVSLLVSDRLEQPSWWATWEIVLGAYSRVKYQLWREVFWGTEDLNSRRYGQSTDPLPYLAASKMRVWLLENPTYDENNQLLVVPIY